MHEIESNLLWLGNADDARQPQPIFDASIVAIVDIAFEERPAMLPRQLNYLRFPLNDGGGNDPARLRIALSSLIGLLSENMTTLVACSAGMSRSPTLAAFALASHFAIDAETALQQIANKKTLEVNGHFWSEVRQAATEIRGRLS